MTRAAVFVDAGYLFAQGSAALVGTKHPRAYTEINESAAVAELRQVVNSRAPSASLLRVYWYDGVTLYKGLSVDQARIAEAEDIKIRFGFLNSKGEQKGVDSLIVTDLIDLARNGAICDAILLSGDEDVRIGVQVAQSYGVRVHLIGVAPSRGSQSKQLRQEADTLTEWDAKTIAKFLNCRPRPVPIAPTVATPGSAGVQPPPTIDSADTLAAVASELVQSLSALEIEGLRAYWATSQRGIPSEFDGKLLARSRARMGGQDLDHVQRKHVREHFSKLAKQRIGHAVP